MIALSPPLDEWSEQSDVGGFLGGSTNTETGIVREETGTYARRTALVKYLMTRRQVSFVSTLGNNIVAPETIEQQAGAIKLLSDAEYLSFVGDDAVVPTEFPGIFAQLEAGIAAGQVDPENILDARGTPVQSVDFFRTFVDDPYVFAEQKNYPITDTLIPKGSKIQTVCTYVNTTTSTGHQLRSRRAGCST